MSKERWADRILEVLTSAMLSEISLTPKPGLVDRGAFSAHQDMDFFSFVRSSAAIAPHFRRIFLLPFEKKDCFGEARKIGMEAETRMLEATGGGNTQKGIIFLGGLLALSCGSLLARGKEVSQKALREEMTNFGKGLTGELRSGKAGSHGEILFSRFGAEGIRGEVERGLPCVFEIGLPVLERRKDKNFNQAGLETLLSIMAACEDTTILWRHGPEVLNEVKASAGNFLSSGLEKHQNLLLLSEMDQDFSRRGISPGGSADLLFLTLALHDLFHEKKGTEISSVPRNIFSGIL